MGNNIQKLFSHKAMRDFSRYANSFNCATQAVAAKTAGSDPDFKTTGTAACVIDGAFVGSLSACATLDMSSSTYAKPIVAPLTAGVLAGKVIADNGQFFLVVTSNATAGLTGTFAYWAHNSATAADDVAPTFKMPYYSPDELTIGVILYDNDAQSGTFTIGTTSVAAADDTYYQLIGPSIMPHLDMFDKN
jgi:hypothetical protein